MLFYSHVWDLLLKAALLALLLVLANFLRIDAALGVLPMIVILTAVWIFVYRQWLSTISAWLYARIGLGADVTLAEARRLRRLFQLDLSVKWVPLTEVRQLPKEQRRAAVLTALQVWWQRRRAMLI